MGQSQSLVMGIQKSVLIEEDQVNMAALEDVGK
jgi:hypothetical protein